MTSYCRKCGKPTIQKQVEDKLRELCEHCGAIYYEQLKVGAGAIVVKDGRLLLVQRGQWPFEYSWGLPAGYLEYDESPEEAVIREVREETGLTIGIDGLFGVYFYRDDPRGNGVMIVYLASLLDGKLKAGTEEADVRFFTPSLLPKNLTTGGHDRAIKDWQERGQANIV